MKIEKKGDVALNVDKLQECYDYVHRESRTVSI